MSVSERSLTGSMQHHQALGQMGPPGMTTSGRCVKTFNFELMATVPNYSLIEIKIPLNLIVRITFLFGWTKYLPIRE